MTPAALALIATRLEINAGALTTANIGISGYWKRIANAAEAIAGTSSAANDNIRGRMLRTAVALETLSATSGAEENLTEAGLLKRIVEAFDVLNGATSIGTLQARFAAAVAMSGPRFNFLTGALDSRIIASGGTNGTRVNSAGLIVAASAPRFDYDPVTLAAKGLLIEEARTNLVTYSEQFDNAAWTKTDATISQDAAVSPDGTTDADKLVENTATGVHDVRRDVAASASTAYTQSILVKASGRTRGQMQMFGNSGGSTVTYDLTAGTATAAGAYGGWSSASATITNFGNGWYRITNTATTNIGLTSFTAVYLMADASGSGSYTGDGTSGMFLYGAQVEAGAFATSYIPTTSATVTRAKDLPVMTGTNFSDWFNQTEGAFFVEFDLLAIQSAPRVIGNNANQSTFIAVVSTNTCTYDGTQHNIGPGTTANTTVRAAMAYDAANRYGSVNGAAALTAVRNVGGSQFTPTTSIQLGHEGTGGGISHLNGHIRRLSYYPTRPSNAQLAALTA